MAKKKTVKKKKKTTKKKKKETESYWSDDIAKGKEEIDRKFADRQVESMWSEDLIKGIEASKNLDETKRQALAKLTDEEKRALGVKDELNDDWWKTDPYHSRDLKKKADQERIEKTQEHLYAVPASEIEEGGWCWKINDMSWLECCQAFYGPPNAYMDHTDKDGDIYFVARVWSEDVYIRTDSNEIVIKQPDDYDGNEDQYDSDEYWLQKADELGYTQDWWAQENKGYLYQVRTTPRRIR
jgi:hypothetical protein